MSIIFGEIDLCSCTHAAETQHDAFGCAICDCQQTPAQLFALRELRDSLGLFKQVHHTHATIAN